MLDSETFTTSQRVVIEATIPAILTLWSGGSCSEAGEYLDYCKFADYSLHNSDLEPSSEVDEDDLNKVDQ